MNLTTYDNPIKAEITRLTALTEAYTERHRHVAVEALHHHRHAAGGAVSLFRVEAYGGEAFRLQYVGDEPGNPYLATLPGFIKVSDDSTHRAILAAVNPDFARLDALWTLLLRASRASNLLVAELGLGVLAGHIEGPADLPVTRYAWRLTTSILHATMGGSTLAPQTLLRTVESCYRQVCANITGNVTVPQRPARTVALDYLAHRAEVHAACEKTGLVLLDPRHITLDRAYMHEHCPGALPPADRVEGGEGAWHYVTRDVLLTAAGRADELKR